jgi:PAS domain S-box-containing protein
MTDPVAKRCLTLLRQGRDAAAGLQFSSLLYASIVFLAALPVVGLSLAGAWFAGMAALNLLEKGLGATARAEDDGRTQAIAAWLINLGFSLAASYLLYFYTGPPQTFGVTLLGVLMFRTLVRDYARPRRMFINLIPPLSLLGLIQIGAGLTQLGNGTPWMVLPTLSSGALVLWVLRALFLDLSGNLRRLSHEATRADRSEKTVATSAKLTELAEELAGVSHWRFDLSRQIFTFGRGAARILGMPGDVDELTPDEMFAMYAPEDRDRVRRALQDAIAEVRPYNTEAAILMPDGERRYVATNGAFQRDGTGRVITVFGMIMDVTDARRREQALQESEARFRMIADHGTDVVVWLSTDGLIRYVSPSVRSFGYDEAELIGSRTVDFVHSDDVERASEILRDLFAGTTVDKDVRREYRVREKGGTYRWLEGNPTLVSDPQTGLRSCITSYRDVTARRVLEDDLIEAKVRAEAAADAKSEFLTNMSHEIRTPLTAIIGFASLLQRLEALPESARTYVNRIASSGDTLLSLVNDILDFARMEASDIQLRPVPFSLQAELQDTVAMFAEIAAHRGLTLALDVTAPEHQQPVADWGRLRQVVVNLISNALKFTDRGGVTVTAEFDPETEQLRVAVADTGLGIPPDKLGQLFQRFSQLDGSSNRRHGGTGLGLSICAKLVGVMGGGITVESSFGTGSTFRFHVPAAATAITPRDIEVERRLAPRSSGRRILVVDDVAVNRELIRAMLEATGQSVIVAEGGEQALDLAGQQTFDLVFMDLQMPGTDGYQAAHRIRIQGGPNADTPIIALSANVLPEHRDATARAGMNGHIAKPISPAELLMAVDQWSMVRLDRGPATLSVRA